MAELNREASATSSALAWQAESWRLTAFLSASSQISEPSWWTDLVGEPPETRVSNPRQGLLQEQGGYCGGTLILAIQPGRVDWQFTAVPIQGEESVNADPLLGPALEALENFRPLALRWLELSPPITRLAVGAILLQTVVDREEAYRLITRYVPGLRLDSEGCKDFFYQINRPRLSTAHSQLRINRLTKWSAATAGLVRVGLPTPSIVSRVELYLGARLELDISTAEDSNTQLSATDLPALLGELINLGLEIADRGDTP